MHNLDFFFSPPPAMEIIFSHQLLYRIITSAIVLYCLGRQTCYQLVYFHDVKLGLVLRGISDPYWRCSGSIHIWFLSVFEMDPISHPKISISMQSLYATIPRCSTWELTQSRICHLNNTALMWNNAYSVSFIVAQSFSLHVLCSISYNHRFTFASHQSTHAYQCCYKHVFLFVGYRKWLERWGLMRNG